MSDGGGEKTEEPTPEKLRKLREDGNVPKSQDVNAAFSFLAVFVVLGISFQYVSQLLLQYTSLSMRLAAHSPYDMAKTAMILLQEGMGTMALATAPTLSCALIIGLAMNYAQVGVLFSTKPITPDFNRINPISGFKNLINMKKVVELLKTIFKFIIISVLAYYALRSTLRDLTLVVRSDLITAMLLLGKIVWDFVSKIGLAFLVIAGFDALYQQKRFIKDNRMTKHDIKQEYKQSEGDPQHKHERRRLHQEILSGGGPSGVKGADVVVRNPHHIAVALRYDKDKGGAPEITAKGERLWAEQILAEARKYDVPIVQNVPLAQALNKLDVGDEIPESLYQAVAEVLTFVYALEQGQRQKGRSKPQPSVTTSPNPKALPRKQGASNG